MQCLLTEHTCVLKKDKKAASFVTIGDPDVVLIPIVCYTNQFEVVTNILFYHHYKCSAHPLKYCSFYPYKVQSRDNLIRVLLLQH